ncbi:MAG TPA: SpoIIE family protein phosphatase [Candidatus Dormibacteraeota bacterium]
MAGLTLAADSAVFGSGPILLEWAVAGAPADGQQVSGDSHLVDHTEQGVLLAVVDALGHGADAAAVADRAVAAMRTRTSPRLDDLVRRCHEAMVGTRGAVIAIAWLGADAVLTWLVVGNVNAMLMRRHYANLARHAAPISHAGVLGMRLPRIGARSLSLRSGDLLVMATDGIDPRFTDDLGPVADLSRATRRLLERSRIPSDDALVLMARCTVLER